MTRTRIAWTVAAVAVAATLIACGADTGDSGGKGGITEVAASPGATTVVDESPAATKSEPPKVKAWGAGTYKVGDDISAGSYKTEGAPDGCYWERLKSDSGEFDDIIANDNLDDDAPGRLTIKKTDKFVKFSGDCKWIKA